MRLIAAIWKSRERDINTFPTNEVTLVFSQSSPWNSVSVSLSFGKCFSFIYYIRFLLNNINKYFSLRKNEKNEGNVFTLSQFEIWLPEGYQGGFRCRGIFYYNLFFIYRTVYVCFTDRPYFIFRCRRDSRVMMWDVGYVIGTNIAVVCLLLHFLNKQVCCFELLTDRQL